MSQDGQGVFWGLLVRERLSVLRIIIYGGLYELSVLVFVIAASVHALSWVLILSTLLLLVCPLLSRQGLSKSRIVLSR